MKNIKVSDFINVTNAKLLYGSEDEILGEFKKDTREIEKGDVYLRNKRRKGRWKYFL